MPEPLRLGILGAGMIATAPAGVLPGMTELAGRATVAAIASRTPGKAHDAAARFGIPNVFADLTSMLASGEVDAVANLTPIGAHVETSREILEAGVHLVSEKPFATTSAEADELIATARETGSRIVVAPARMIEPSRRRARALLDQGVIGTVPFARARVSHAGPGGMTWPTDPRPAYRADAGPLRDMAPYAIEQLVGLISPVRRVAAMTARSRPSFPAYGDGPFAGVEIVVESDDTVVLMLELESGCIATVDASFGPVQSSSPAVELYGTDGTIQLRTVYPPDVSPRIEMYRRGLDAPGSWLDPSTPEDVARQEQLVRLGRASLVEHLVHHLESGEPIVLDGARARHVVAVIEAAEQSARHGSFVEV